MDYEKLYRELKDDIERWGCISNSAETVITLALILRAAFQREKEGE